MDNKALEDKALEGKGAESVSSAAESSSPTKGSARGRTQAEPIVYVPNSSVQALEVTDTTGLPASLPASLSPVPSLISFTPTSHSSTPVSIKVMSRAPAKGGMRFKYDRPEAKQRKGGRQGSSSSGQRALDNKASASRTKGRSGSPIREYEGVRESPRDGALSPYGGKRSNRAVHFTGGEDLFDDDDDDEEVLYDGADIDIDEQEAASGAGGIAGSGLRSGSATDNKRKEIHASSSTTGSSSPRRTSKARPKSAVAGGASRYKKRSITRPASARRPISSKRRAQLDEVEAVKRAFAKYNIKVGAGVLER